MLKDALNELDIEKLDEQSVETKEVTVKLKFTFVDGEIQDEEQRAIYEMISPKDDIIEEASEETNDFTNEFQE